MIPAHMLRPLLGHRRSDVTDPDDGSVTAVWDTIAVAGRLTRGAVTESTDNARQAAASVMKLLTNDDRLNSADRIEDPATSTMWELAGQPVPVWATASIHHYEVPLRHVQG